MTCNVTGVAGVAGLAYLSGAPDVTHVFVGFHIVYTLAVLFFLFSDFRRNIFYSIFYVMYIDCFSLPFLRSDSLSETHG